MPPKGSKQQKCTAETSDDPPKKKPSPTLETPAVVLGSNFKPKTPIDHLCVAAEKGDLSSITSLLDRGVDVNSAGGMNSLPPLEFAVMYGRLDAVRLLLDRGADPNGGENGFLGICAHKGKVEIAKLLLSRGADWRKKDVNNENALDIAREYGNEEVAALFK